MPAAPIRMGKLRLASGVFYYLAQRLFAALRAISARFFAPIDLAREPDSQYIRPDVDNASTYHAESARGAKGNIDHAISNKGTSIVDRDDDSPIAFRVGYSTRVPNGNVRCAAVKLLGSARAPLAALPPYE